MWFAFFLILALAWGGEVKVLYQDGRVGVVQDEALKRLKSAILYWEKPKPLRILDPVVGGSSVATHVRGSVSFSLPLQAGQVLNYWAINTSFSFSGPCTQSSNALQCGSGNLMLNLSSSDGRLILSSSTHSLTLPPGSYWLGTGARLSGRTGAGVVAVVIDTGIDVCHPEFEDRIIFFYDATTNTELDQNAIRQARQRRECDRDFGGHGTPVAGILAGRNVGMAPGASLIAIKVVNQNGDITDATVMRAIEYVRQKRQSLGRPMVVNLSLGNTFGPGDGNSMLELSIEQNVGAGLILVAANGNEGHLRIRAVVEGRSSGEVPINLTADIPFEVWYGSASLYRLELCDSLGRCATSTPNSFSSNLPCVRGVNHTLYPPSSKRYAEFDHACSGSYILRFSLLSGPISRLDLFGGFEGNSFGAFTVEDGKGGYLYTVSLPATGRRVIGVGAISSFALSSGSRAFNSLGDIAYFSSRGPTVDGRVKPDISAGGYVVYTAEEGGTYGYNAGTSFSSPVVAGLIALLLEANPNLTPEGAKELLCQMALKDSAVGSTPNNFFGCGKAYVGALTGSSGGELPSGGGSGTGGGGGGGGCNTGSGGHWLAYAFLLLLVFFRRKGKLNRVQDA
ncbi:MAG: S8 family serine peptidase [Aquificaceae bacterium]|nr:S8 family serine peptidase [Aquificaceae bacterium]